MMKKSALILALLIALNLLPACSGKETVKDTGTDGSTSDSVSENEVKDPFDALPEENFDGRAIRVVARAGYEDELCVDESSGDKLEEAVYKRNRAICDKFNVSFEWTITEKEYSDLGKTEILANEDAFDILMIHSRMAFHFMNQGLLHDWNDNMPYIDFD